MWSTTSGGDTVYSLVAANDSTTESYTDGGTTFSVPRGWMASHGLTSVSGLGDTGDNGLTYFTSYALGLDPTNETDKPIASVAADGDSLVITLKHADGTAIEAPNGVALTLTLKHGSNPANLNETMSPDGGTGAASTFTIDPAGVTRVEYYQVSVAIGTAE